MCLKKVAYRSPPPAPVRAPLAERPGSAVRRCNRSRAAGAEPHPPNWPTQRRPLLLVGSGVAMPVPRPAPPVSTTFANGAPQGFLWSFAPVSLAGGLLSAVAGFAVRWLRPLLLVPYGDPLPPLPLPPVCWLLPPWPRLTPRLWQPGRQSRGGFGEWRLRLLCAARSLSVGACQGIRCSNGS